MAGWNMPNGRWVNLPDDVGGTRPEWQAVEHAGWHAARSACPFEVPNGRMENATWHDRFSGVRGTRSLVVKDSRVDGFALIGLSSC